MFLHNSERLSCALGVQADFEHADSAMPRNPVKDQTLFRACACEGLGTRLSTVVSSPDPTHKIGKGLVTFERFLGCAVSAERTRLHTAQYVLCHMRAAWLSHDC